MTGVKTCFAEREQRREQREGAALGQAFTAALLLTGSVKQAEAAVLESIARLDVDGAPVCEKLVNGALQIAVARDCDFAEQGPGELAQALSLLPKELQRVLQLPPHLRRSFTLRVLARMPARECAVLLHKEIHEIERAVAEAVQELAAASGAGCCRHRYWQLTSG